jgi:predicted Fe-Mo cluster-binding NifX family protein
MKVAVPTYGDRVSPVFDVARCLLVVDIDRGREVGREDTAITEADPGLRARHVADLGVDVLICGAVSRLLEGMLQAAGVRVIVHVCGPVEDVLRAFLSDGLTDQTFLMPGCCGRRRRARGRRGGGRRRLDAQGETV